MLDPRRERGNLVVEQSDGVGFAGALYLRDRFGLRAWTHVPPLDPAVASTSSRTAVPDGDWAAWWQALVEAPAATPVSPPVGSPLADLYDGLRDELTRWVQARHHESSAAMRGYRPDWLPPWIDVSTATGRHVTEVVPVSGPWTLALTSRRLLVSVETMRDHAAMDTLWRAQLTALEAPRRGRRPAPH